MLDALKYVNLVLCHKFYVLCVGIILDVSVGQLLKHDWSKFSRKEFGPGIDFFVRKMPRSEAIQKAAIHHYIHNPHHWQFWVGDDGAAWPMPEKYIREMIADWAATQWEKTRSYDFIPWLEKNISEMNLHPETKADMTRILETSL